MRVKCKWPDNFTDLKYVLSAYSTDKIDFLRLNGYKGFLEKVCDFEAETNGDLEETKYQCKIYSCYCGHNVALRFVNDGDK